MIRVSIIGSGNVAQHLIQTFNSDGINPVSSNIELVQVFARKKESVSDLIATNKIYTNFNKIIPADLFIIAITDGAIAEVSKELPFNNQLVAHTSGSVSDRKSVV